MPGGTIDALRALRELHLDRDCGPPTQARVGNEAKQPRKRRTDPIFTGVLNTDKDATVVVDHLKSLASLDYRYADVERLVVQPEVELYYEIRGSAGPALVLVNNFFMLSPAWRTFTSQLESKYRILSYDLRNQGGSSRTPTNPSWNDHVADLRAVVDNSGFESTYLLGTSASALLCRDFAIRYPSTVKGLILAGPALGATGMERPRRMTESWLTTLDNLGMPALFDQMYPSVFGSGFIESVGTPGYLALREGFLMLHSRDEIRCGLAGALQASPDVSLLEELTVPTLVLVGDDDCLVSASAAEEIAERIPMGRSRIIRGAGHLPFLEATDEFERLVDEFVDEIEARR